MVTPLSQFLLLFFRFFHFIPCIHLQLLGFLVTKISSSFHCKCLFVTRRNWSWF
jgi:hypothetical protein